MGVLGGSIHVMIVSEECVYVFGPCPSNPTNEFLRAVTGRPDPHLGPVTLRSRTYEVRVFRRPKLPWVAGKGEDWTRGYRCGS